jgi:hypothetical protein
VRRHDNKAPASSVDASVTHHVIDGEELIHFRGQK